MTAPGGSEDYRVFNRANWDDRAPAHAASPDYAVQRFLDDAAFVSDVVRFDLPAGFKVPHMGWNRGQQRQASPLLAGIDDGAYFYFVHSYYAVPAEAGVVLLEADYGGPFCAAVERGNLFATQFHPEKSQAAGLRLLKNFAELEA